MAFQVVCPDVEAEVAQEDCRQQSLQLLRRLGLGQEIGFVDGLLLGVRVRHGIGSRFRRRVVLLPLLAVSVEVVLQRLEVIAGQGILGDFIREFVALDQPLHSSPLVCLDLDVKFVVVALRHLDGRLGKHAIAVDRFDRLDFIRVKRVLGPDDDGGLDLVALDLLAVLFDLGTRVLIGHVELGVFRDDGIQFVDA